MAIKQIVSKSNLGAWFDTAGVIEAGKVNPVLPSVTLTPVAFTPTTTGNATNRNEYVIDPAGDKWFIDYAGDALKLDSPGTVQSLTNGLHLTGTVGKLGGALTENTTITGAYNLLFNNSGTIELNTSAGDIIMNTGGSNGIYMSPTSGNLTIYNLATDNTEAHLLAIDNSTGLVSKRSVASLGAITGTGAANRVALWNGAGSLTSDAGITWSSGSIEATGYLQTGDNSAYTGAYPTAAKLRVGSSAFGVTQHNNGNTVELAFLTYGLVPFTVDGYAGASSLKVPIQGATNQSLFLQTFNSSVGTNPTYWWQARNDVSRLVSYNITNGLDIGTTGGPLRFYASGTNVAGITISGSTVSIPTFTTALNLVRVANTSGDLEAVSLATLGIPTGSGTNGRMTLWGASGVTSDANFLWSSPSAGNGLLDVAGNINTSLNYRQAGVNKITSAGTFLASNGSVSDVGYGWVGDQDTGFIRATANTIGVVTNGVEIARFTADGNLGLGATPNNYTKIYATRAGDTHYRFETSSGGVQMYLTAGSTGYNLFYFGDAWSIGGWPESEFVLSKSGVERLRVKNDGRMIVGKSVSANTGLVATACIEAGGTVTDEFAASLLVNQMRIATTPSQHHYAAKLRANSTRQGSQNHDVNAGLVIENPTLTVSGTGAGQFLSNKGIVVEEITGAAYNQNLVLGAFGWNLPTGDYSIYSASTRNSYFAGSTGFGIIPTTNLHVAGTDVYAANTDGQFTISDSALPAKKMTLGYDATNNFAYINSIYSGASVSPLVLNPQKGVVKVSNLDVAGYVANAVDGTLSTVTAATLGAAIAASTNYWTLSSGNLYRNSKVSVGSGSSLVNPELLSVDGSFAINGATAASSYTLYRGAGTSIAVTGSDAAILGGTAGTFGTYVYGNNEYYISTNGVKRLVVDGDGTLTTMRSKFMLTGGQSTLTSNNHTYTFRDVHTSTHNTTATGVLDIELGLTMSAQFNVWKVKGYDYSTNAEWECTVAFHNDYAAFYQVRGHFAGHPKFSRVRLSLKGGKVHLLLGETTTVWSIATIVVSEGMTSGNTAGALGTFSSTITTDVTTGHTLTGDVNMFPSKITLQDNTETEIAMNTQSTYNTRIVTRYDSGEPFYIQNQSTKSFGIKSGLGAGGSIPYINGYYGFALTTGSQNPETSHMLIFGDGANNRVGIGTNTPTEKLTVNGRILAIASGYTVNPTGAMFGFYNGGGVATSYLQTPVSGQVQIWNAGTMAIATFKDNGNSGIGTEAPITRLHIDKPSQAYGGTTPNGALVITGLAGGNYALELGTDAAAVPWIQSRNATSATYYNLAINPSGGNVGIGTITPAYALDVEGTIHASGAVTGVSIRIDDYRAIRNNGHTYFDTGFGGTGDLQFRVGTSATTAMVVKNNGTVQIPSLIPAGNIVTVQDSSGTLTSATFASLLGTAGVPTGGGANNRITLWNGSNTLTNDTNIQYGLSGGAGIILGSGYYSGGHTTSLFSKTNATGILTLGNNGVNEFRAGASATGGYFNFYVNNSVGPTANTNGGLAMTMQADGSIGFGTASPLAKINIEGVGETAVLISSSDNTQWRGVVYGVNATNTKYGSQMFHANSGELRTTAGFAGWGGLQTFYTDGAERMRINTNGNVGIGINAPLSQLSNTSDMGGISAANATGIAWKTTTNDWGFALRSDPASGNGYAARFHTTGITSSDYILALSSGAGVGTIRVAVKGDGNVAIGTTTADSKFRVLASNGAGLRIDFSGTNANYYTANNHVIANSSSGLLMELADNYLRIPKFTVAGNILTVDDVNGVITSVTPASLGIVNWYTTDGTLTSNRTVTQAGYTLNFTENIGVYGITVGRGPGNVDGNFTFATYSATTAKTGANNIFIGADAGKLLTSGSQNVFLGNFAGRDNVTGAGNVCIGQQAGKLYTSNVMTAVGNFALQSATQPNTAVGSSALQYVTSGGSNVALGEGTGAAGTVGHNLTTGQYNTFLGTKAGFGIVDGNYNVVIGRTITELAASLSNNVIIGDGQGNIVLHASPTNVKSFIGGALRLDVKSDGRVRTPAVASDPTGLEEGDTWMSTTEKRQGHYIDSKKKHVMYREDILDTKNFLLREDFLKTNNVPTLWAYAGDTVSLTATSAQYGYGGFAVTTDTAAASTNGFANLYQDADFKVDTSIYDYFFEFLFDPTNPPNPTDTGEIYLGVGGTSSQMTTIAVPNNFVGFKIYPDLGSSYRYSFVRRNGGTETSSSTSTVVTTGTRRLGVKWTAGRLIFYENGVELLNTTTMTDVPAANTLLRLMVKSITAVSAAVEVGGIVASAAIQFSKL